MDIFYSLVAAFFITFGIYCVRYSLNNTQKKRDAALERAIRDGHVVNAVKYKQRSSQRRDIQGWEWESEIGYYRYEYKGKTYKYWLRMDNPPATLKLYFVKNPRKATVAGALNPVTTNWPMVFAIVAVLLYFLVYRN